MYIAPSTRVLPFCHKAFDSATMSHFYKTTPRSANYFVSRISLPTDTAHRELSVGHHHGRSQGFDQVSHTYIHGPRETAKSEADQRS